MFPFQMCPSLLFHISIPSPQTVAEVTALEKAINERLERYRRQVAEDLSDSRYGMATEIGME